MSTNNLKTERYVENVFARGEMIQQINERVTLQSRRYVYGMSDAQLTFVSRRLGKAAGLILRLGFGGLVALGLNLPDQL